ncbi:MAG: 16S rRNA (cytosine(1407)-C(5))-methyltransferase RsmF [Anaerolineae bacterium]
MMKYDYLLSPAAQQALQAALAQPLPQAFRLNTLKRDDVQGLAAQYGWQVEPVPFCSTGWVVRESAATPLSHTYEYRMGQYFIQEAASMLPVELFDFEATPAPVILDMAAAPGGKTTHLVSSINDTGIVIANDSSKNRLGSLRSNLRDWSAGSTAVTNLYGEMFGRLYPDTFDKVLLDAPCSMENLHTDMREISDQERKSLSERQTRLLMSALEAVRPGGEVVYSTCTLSPEEDEGVVDTVLRRYGRYVSVKPVSERLPVEAPGLLADGARAFLPEVAQAVRLWPHLYHTAGFFAVALLKHDSWSTENNQDAPEVDRRQKTFADKFTRLSKRDHRILSERLLDFGFDLEAFTRCYQFDLYKLSEKIFAIPAQFPRLFNTLAFSQVGLLLAELQGDTVIPSHELVTRCPTDFEDRHTLPQDAVEGWLVGRDVPNSFKAEGALILQDEMGRFIGVGLAQHKRIRNLLPTRVKS